MHCEDMQHQPRICIAYPGKNDNLNPLPYDLPFLAMGPALVWSPDGNQIALSAQLAPLKLDERGLKLFIIAADGYQIRQITTVNMDDIMHDWSPDGKWIAFHRNVGELWLIQPDGSDAHLILPGHYYVLTSAWSPDSQMLTFLSRPPAEANAPNAIWVVQWDGSNPRMLYTFERLVEGCQIGWRPDGRIVAALCRYEDTTEENKLLLEIFGDSAPTFADSVPPSWFQYYWPRWEQ
jgi:Tol biopolymer transport system component